MQAQLRPTIGSLAVVVAQPSDLPNYIDLLEETAAWLDARGVGQIPPGTYRAFAIYYRDSIAAGEVYLGVIGQTIVGTFRLVHDDGAVWPGAGDDALCLENLVVRREWSGHGVGRWLLSWAEQRVASMGKTYLRLDCFANNSVLRKYYEAAGYEGCGEIEASFPFGDLRLQRYQKELGVIPTFAAGFA